VTSGLDSGSTSGFCDSTCSFSYQATQSFNYESADVQLDVTSIVKAWLCGCVPNEGLIVKFTNECDSSDYGTLKFFSMESNTIYAPYLECNWVDAVFNAPPTSSAVTVVTGDERIVYVENLKQKYTGKEKVKMDVFCREKYPRKTFSLTADYLKKSYLPSGSYYSVSDVQTSEVWIPYSDYTKISCGVSGSYFNFDMSTLPQERYFKFSIKVITDVEEEEYVDSRTFKVTR
jgi:hypothetical protein